MIEVRELRVQKDGRAICTVPKLHVASGERVAILGANGSGKTTLLRVLAGIEANVMGHCHVAVPRVERVFVHQVPYLFRGSVLSNVTYGLRQRRLPRTECKLRATEWLERFGIQGKALESAACLSGGERRRVALARAMALRPRLLLLDEPFSDMDASGTTAVISAINDLPETTVVIASPSKLPAELASREKRLES